jgi:chromosome segregation ATPase
LKIEKIKKEKDVDLSNFHSELDNKDTIVEKLEEELEQIKAELEFKEEELAAKTEELEDLSTDLEVSTAGFNNSFKETNDTHKEEIEVLISKVETANSSIANLHETLARTTADHDTRIDELMSSHKSQMNNVQDRLSEKEQNILELNAKISDVEGKLSMTVSSMNDEAKVTETRIEKMLNENEDIRAKKGESDAMIRSLQTDYDSATHQNEVLYIKIVEKEEHIRQVTTQVESMKISFEKTQRELSERMDRTGQDTLAIEDLHKEIEVERSRVDEMQLAYAEIEGERDTLQEKYKDHDILKEQQAETEERESMLIRNVEDLKQKHEFAVEEFDAERSELNEVVQRSKKLVQDKLEEFKVQQFKFEQLQAENNQLNSYKRQVLLLEQEKRGWESSRPSASFMKEASPAKSIDDDAESLRSQVDFLNSVIVVSYLYKS